jgi:hypothetical protein
MSHSAAPAPPCSGESPPPVSTLIMSEFIAALEAAKKARQEATAKLVGFEDAKVIPLPEAAQSS